MKTGFFSTLYAAWLQRREAHATRLALQSLDARTLRDIGLDASEIMSVACEASGIAEPQRIARYVPHY